MIVKKMHYNNRTIGICEKETNKEIFSMTPMDFYLSFDAISDFLKDVRHYTKPKLYPTRNDLLDGKKIAVIKSTWGDRYKLLLNEAESRIGYGHNYGEYTIEELKIMHNAMWDYVKDAKTDIIFECRSSDISNIDHNPYTIYMDVYNEQGTDMTPIAMRYLAYNGHWYYNSRTLRENLEYVRNNFDLNGKLKQMEENGVFEQFYEMFIKPNMTPINHFFKLINNYKKL